MNDPNMDDPKMAAAREHATEFLQAFTWLGIEPVREFATAYWQPLPADYARVFQGEAIETARDFYKDMWAVRPYAGPKPGQTKLKLTLATPAMMLADSQVGLGFPGGYQRVIPYLNQDLIWAIWRFSKPGSTSGMRYEGLVQVEERRWAWFPKIHHALRGLTDN